MPRGIDMGLSAAPAAVYPSEDVSIDWTRAGDLNYIQALNTRVADKLFPDRQPSSMFFKMYEEIGEMVKSPDDPEEIADLLIMLLDRMSKLNAHAGLQIMLKLEKNLKREWIVNPATGVAYHKDHK
jgi:hypothetical protein